MITNSKQETEKIMKSVAQEYVEQGVAKGVKIGIAQGIAQGVVEGIAQSLAKILAEGLAQGVQIGRGEAVRQIARDMLFEFHLDLGTVKRATKLSQEDLNQIIKGKYQK